MQKETMQARQRISELEELNIALMEQNQKNEENMKENEKNNEALLDFVEEQKGNGQKLELENRELADHNIQLQNELKDLNQQLEEFKNKATKLG